MSTFPRSETMREQRGSTARSTVTQRQPRLRVLFVHREMEDVERCLRELKSVQIVVSADVVQTPRQFTERLRSRSYDLVVAEYPSPTWRGSRALELLRRTGKEIPLIYVIDTLRRKTVLEFTKRDAGHCIEMDRIALFPMVVRRALDEKHLRGERDRAEKELRHSKAYYRALVENPNYGICRCRPDGKFLDVNQALVTMLGYTSREELLTVDLASHILGDPGKRAQLLEYSPRTGRIHPVEIEWKRKDGTILKARLSGREVRTEQGRLKAYELIAEDISSQRALEDQLRHRATSDPLTGLANYRQLVDVLDAELRRSHRTGKEFVVLLFDLDRLKQINDRHGHMTGSRALCRLANVLSICCRSIDTAARFGGDEFAIVLPETGAEAAILVARRICECFANDGEEPLLSVSAGFATYPQDGETIESLLHAADRALYKMKSRQENFCSVGHDASCDAPKVRS
jgi:diguanylate cyclase (GGDEF)-like protein/PAS domain S-box-containing protein